MGVKFAGSRSINERRRRRLAGENETSSPSASQLAPGAGFWKIRPIQLESEHAPSSPLQSLIPLSRLRIWSLCVALPLLTLLLVSFAQAGSLIPDPKIRSVISLQQVHLWRFICGSLFIGSAGLCWLISWFRSASDQDFEGCYKSWYFSGWVFLFFGFIAGCDAHLAFSQILGDSVQLQGEFLQTLLWVVPMSAFLIEPVRCFAREMWHCKRSYTMMAMCCLVSITFLEMKLPASGQTSFYTSQVSQFIIVATSMLAPALISSALLSQTHYVMYVSSDPVPQRKSWTLAAITWAKQKILVGLNLVGHYIFTICKSVSSYTRSRIVKQIVKQIDKTEKKTDSATEPKAKPKQQPKPLTKQKPSNSPPVESTPFKQRAADQHKKKTVAKTAQAPTAPEPKQPASKPRIRLKPQPQTEHVEAQQTSVTDTNQPEEEMIAAVPRSISMEPENVDPSNLKGLSKKERRRIRKLHREQQRAG